jgi:hypothetical protein
VKAFHHVTILTFEPEPLLEVLRHSIGLPLVQEFVAPGDTFATLLKVPEAGDVRCWIVGHGNSGLIEVCQLHESLRGQVEPGPRLLVFTARNLQEVIEACASRDGIAVTGPVEVPALDMTSVVVSAGGADLEFVNFAR